MRWPNHILNPWVFYPPVVLLSITLAFNLIDASRFLALVNLANTWVLDTFGSVFAYSTFLFLVLLLVAYVSPLAKVKIGGENAVPLLNRWRWFAVSVCTTIATGILFWGCAEPLYHYFSPPANSGILGSSPQAMEFSMSTLFMHWSFTPYGIYCITGLVFALVYYNLNRPFRIGSLLYPLFPQTQAKGYNTLFDVLCLYALVLGMAASLGAGILAIMGGMEYIFGLPKSTLMIFVVGSLILAAFVVSAISGLQKGIKWLSTINIIGFVFIALYVFFLGNPSEILSIGRSGLQDYLIHFIPRSINLKNSLDPTWMGDWTFFYLANWFAWAPVASLFLGRIARGYTVREFILFNLIAPSIFAIVWMTIFGGNTLYLNEILDNALYHLMAAQGEERVMYEMIGQFKHGFILSIITLLLVFLSYVTAADSNISAMSALSTKLPEKTSSEAPRTIKIIWGVLIGAIACLMLVSAGVDGIRILCVLGGFPALFIVIIAAASLIQLMVSKDKDFKENT